jgi:hypothetical protein
MALGGRGGAGEARDRQNTRGCGAQSLEFRTR